MFVLQLHCRHETVRVVNLGLEPLNNPKHIHLLNLFAFCFIFVSFFHFGTHKNHFFPDTTARSTAEPSLGSAACEALGLAAGSNLLYLAAQCGLDRTCDLLIQRLGGVGETRCFICVSSCLLFLASAFLRFLSLFDAASK